MAMELPTLPAFLQCFERGDRYVVVNPLLPSWIVTDALGLNILSLIGQGTPRQEIIDIIASAIGEESRDGTDRFCDLVAASHLLDTAAPQQAPRDGSLRCVHLSLSSRCNLSCRYCYAAERRETTERLLTLEQWRTVIDDLCDIAPGITFTITGGEPLLNPLWSAVAKHIKDNPRSGRLHLLTNGLLINERNIDTIARYFDLVTLSIDGSTPESHALTRGDNLAQVVKAADLLERKGIDYTISMTVTKLNIDQVEPMARRYGALLNYQPLFPVNGEASESIAISGREYYEVLTGAFGVNPLGYCEASLDASRQRQSHKCAIGDNEISISASGDVYPCQLLHVPEFYAGNVAEQSVKEIYGKAESLLRCAELDVNTIEKCARCAVRYICGGACRARAYYETGDIASAGDFCTYEHEALIDGIAKLYSTDALTIDS